MTERDPGSDRESFLSVRKKWWAVFSAIFSLKVIAAAAFIARYEVQRGGHADIEETVMAVGVRLALVPMLALVSCIMLFQAVELIMFIRETLSNIFVERIRQRHREEGAAQAHEEWDSWYRRLTEAAEKGEPFDEPPPKPPGEPR